jgi:hypothetical protein
MMPTLVTTFSWLQTPETDSMFYRPAASAMNVLLGQHAAAFDNITYLLHNRIEGSTWYREGAQGSCTETPYAAAWAVTDWLVQSWNYTLAAKATSDTHDDGSNSERKPATSEASTMRAHVIEFFPAVDDVIRVDGGAYDSAPAKVATAQFYRLSVEGGVLATGARVLVSQNASHYITRTAFVAVERSASAPDTAPVVIRTNMARPLATSPAGVVITEIGDGNLVQVNIKKGEGVALFSAANPPAAPASFNHSPASFTISSSTGCSREFNHWGVPSKGRSGKDVGGTPVVLRRCVMGTNGLVAKNQRFKWNSTTATFVLQDESGQCLSVSTCNGANGDRVTVAPCASGTEPSTADDIGCDKSEEICAAQSQTWHVNGPADSPPYTIIHTATNRCIDVHGATDKDTIDIWDIVPGVFKNEGFSFNTSTGGITALNSNPACACRGFCLTLPSK